MQVGIDRLRRYEHDRRRLHLARDQVAVCDIHDVACRRRHCARAPAPSSFPRRVTAARKVVGSTLVETWRVDHDDDALAPGMRITAVRKLKFAVRSSVYWKVVEASRAGRLVCDDLFHLRLREGAACLLVREHLLKRNHLTRYRRYILLSFVDHGQPFADAAYSVGKPSFRSGFPAQAFAQPLVQRIDPFAQCLLELRLRLQRLAGTARRSCPARRSACRSADRVVAVPIGKGAVLRSAAHAANAHDSPPPRRSPAHPAQ